MAVVRANSDLHLSNLPLPNSVASSLFSVWTLWNYWHSKYRAHSSYMVNPRRQFDGLAYREAFLFKNTPWKYL